MLDHHESNLTLSRENKRQYWKTLLNAFLDCHHNPYKQALHLVSTPLHIAFYLAHLVQEILDLHENTLAYMTKKN